MIFARKTSDGLASLAKKLDAEVAANKNSKMGAFIVFLTEGEEGAEKAIKEFQEKNGIKNVSLAIDNPTGPKGYDIAKDAEFTIVFYKGRKIEANHAFKAGSFDAKAAEKVAGDLSKIVGSK